ncbi:MAG TPA: hypothetical protein VK133_01605 [Amoebophilaceae bacterium]|nr:hypothetical protein [Amoebophilaceae bacterium]
MQTSYTSNTFKHFYFAIVLILFNMISGCEGCGGLSDWVPKVGEQNKGTAARANEGALKQTDPVQSDQQTHQQQPAQQTYQQPTPQSPHRFGIVLLHGLLGSRDGIAEMTAYFQKQFGDEVCILVPTSRAEWNSVNLSIAAQKEKVLAEIQTELAHRGLPGDFPIVPIGYSQGGLIACKLVADGELNSIAFATVNAPLMGTRFGKILQGLGQLQKGFQLSKQHTKGYVDLSQLAGALNADGIQDLVPDSAAIRANQAFLAGGSNNVPGLLVSGFIDDPANKLGLPLPSDWLQQAKAFLLGVEMDDLNLNKPHDHPFNPFYALLLTGKKNANHDSLLSVATQLSQSETVDLTTCLDHASEHRSCTIDPLFPNVKGQIYKDVAHSPYRFNDLGIDFGMETALNSKRVFDGLGAFVREQTKQFTSNQTSRRQNRNAG